MPKLRFLIPYSGAESRACIERAFARCSIFLGEQFRLVDNSQQAMAAADFVVLASGTATLEAMLLRKPMAVFYRLAPLTHLIASRIVDVPHVALPNLLAGKRLVPEAIQSEVTEAAVESQILNYFQIRMRSRVCVNSTACIMSCAKGLRKRRRRPSLSF